MNLIELYDTLSFPDGDEKVFNAIPIPEYPNFRVAIDIEGNPIILLSVANAINNIALKNFRLKYLQLEQNIECKISEKGKSSFQTFTVITFTSADRNLQEYFLRISETLVKTLSNKPTQQQVIESLNKFVEVFRALTDTPTNTVHGLWTELFLIDNSKNPQTLLNYWHNIPEEKFDFNSGRERIEVKSNSNFERQHTFSSEQLNPPEGTQVLIASIFVRQNNAGQSIQQLVDNITIKINHNFDLTDKLNNIVCKTLGNSLEQSIKIKFDYNIARESLLFYRHQDISKIEEVHIPDAVSEVRYKSDLSTLKHIDLTALVNNGELFNSI
ncbi:MAG: PD-(D/E)XK motif protein [Chitinophagaceae bacterium]|nr:PD-(D/E)XK motif protein [Chitinophagaceae bacterium]